MEDWQTADFIYLLFFFNELIVRRERRQFPQSLCCMGRCLFIPNLPVISGVVRVEVFATLKSNHAPLSAKGQPGFNPISTSGRMCF